MSKLNGSADPKKHERTIVDTFLSARIGSADDLVLTTNLPERKPGEQVVALSFKDSNGFKQTFELNADRVIALGKNSALSNRDKPVLLEAMVAVGWHPADPQA